VTFIKIIPTTSYNTNISEGLANKGIRTLTFTKNLSLKNHIPHFKTSEYFYLRSNKITLLLKTIIDF